MMLFALALVAAALLKLEATPTQRLVIFAAAGFSAGVGILKRRRLL